MTKLYGLIGYPLTHSFSQRYFTEKFARESIIDSQYELFSLPDISALPEVLALPGLRGLNVTIPHKLAVLPYLTRLDASAQKTGAVNVIKFETDGSLTGHNSDYYGFRRSLLDWFGAGEGGAVPTGIRALVLGTGGASKAVTAALADLDIPLLQVSRNPVGNHIGYIDLAGVLTDYQLIVNTSPVGTYPDADAAPDLPYDLLTHRHWLYDLVYNPAETQFLQLGRQRGAAVTNGQRMLELQAEKAWDIWQTVGSIG